MEPANAALTTALLRACETLAASKPAIGPDGKAIDRAAFLRWREACLALARKEVAQG